MSFDAYPPGQPPHIDQFLSDQERANFAARRAAVLETAGRYGLDPDNAIIIGGGALALHGADTWVPEGTLLGSAFDLDIIDIEANPGQQRRRMWRRTPEDVVSGDDPEAPLPLTRVRGLTAVNFARNFNYPDYDSMVQHRVTVDKLATLPLDRLVYSKIHFRIPDRMRDEAGIIKAHAVAEGTKNMALLNDPYWRKSVAVVVNRLVNHPFPYTSKQPEWLTKLIDSGFDHPAFRDLRPKS